MVKIFFASLVVYISSSGNTNTGNCRPRRLGLSFPGPWDRRRPYPPYSAPILNVPQLNNILVSDDKIIILAQTIYLINETSFTVEFELEITRACAFPEMHSAVARIRTTVFLNTNEKEEYMQS